MMNGPIKKNPAARDGRAYLKTTTFRTASTPKRQINFEAINRAALRALPAILARFLPCGRIKGREYVALNPTRADRRTGSFKVNLRTGRWADFATGDNGGDAISLVAYIERVSQAEAARRLAGMLGVNLSNEVRR
jgi:CHC2 zinc finger